MNFCYHAELGTPLEEAVNHAITHCQERRFLCAMAGVTPGKGELDYFGLRVPVEIDSTVSSLLGQVQALLEERRDTYSRLDFTSEAKTVTHTGQIGEHISVSALTAQQRAQGLCSKVFQTTPAQLGSTQHVFEFNGVSVTFNPYEPSDMLARRVQEEMARRAEAYRLSPAGQAAEANRVQAVAEGQAAVSRLMEELPEVVRGDLPSVMRWVTAFATQHDHVGIQTDPDAVVATFQGAGFEANAYVGEEYRDMLNRDKEKLGRYIIGQFLAILPMRCGMPGILHAFANDYHAMAA